MRRFILFFLTCGVVGAATPVDLFNGKDLTGWELVTSPAADIAASCQVTNGGVLAVSGKPVGYLLAAGSYADYRLHIEYRWPADAVKNSNSGVLVHIASGPVDRNTIIAGYTYTSSPLVITLFIITIPTLPSEAILITFPCPSTTIHEGYSSNAYTNPTKQ